MRMIVEGTAWRSGRTLHENENRHRECDVVKQQAAAVRVRKWKRFRPRDVAEGATFYQEANERLMRSGRDSPLGSIDCSCEGDGR